MHKKPFDKLSSEKAFECPYYSIQHDRYLLPNKEVGDYFIIARPKAAMVIPRLDNGKFILTKQYRYIFRDWSIEFPAGAGDPGEDFEDVAKRELAEECGVTTSRLQSLAPLAPYNGIADEVCYIYYADHLQPCDATPDPDEQIELLELESAEIDELIKNNKIQDSTTIAAWCLWQKKINNNIKE